MSKRTFFTTTTVLPPGVTRETVLEALHNHTTMVQMNPNNRAIVPCRTPSFATPEESTCIWYKITDRITYLPGISSDVPYYGCFNNLFDGMQSHIYAPLNLDLRNRWTLGGSLPGEPRGPVEFGAPKNGLYLKEDVEIRCNFLVTSFVKKELKAAHHQLVQRLIARAHVTERERHNMQLFQKRTLSEHSGTTSPTTLSIVSERNLGPTVISPRTPPSYTSNKKFEFEPPPIEMAVNEQAVELPAQRELPVQRELVELE